MMMFPPLPSRRSRRGWAMVFCLLLPALGGPVPTRGAQAPADEPRRIAVVGFSPGNRRADPAAENLGAGVADLLEGELDRRGMAVCERRSVALVLSERRLAGAGQTAGAAEAIHQQLPAVRYLLRGTVDLSPEGVATLSASVVDTRSGEEVATFREEGNEAGLAGTVSMMAGKVADRLAGLAGTARPHRSAPGFTRVPEAALLYYRGMAQLLADRPEYAVAFFLEAERLDPAFTTARLWQARAFERLDLPEFAAALRPADGNVPTAGDAPTRPGDHRRRLVAVMAAGPGTTAAVLGAFKERLPAAAPSLRVLNPGLIDALAAEADLRLGGLFEGDGGLRALQGIGTDVAVGLETLPAQPSAGKGARLRVTAVDAGTGTLLARAESAGTTPGDAAGLAENLGRALTAPGPGDDHGPLPAGATPAAAPARYAWPAPGNRPRDELAQTLHHVVRCPRDRRAWIAAARLLPNDRARGSLARLAWDRLAASVDPREPDAATWLSTALWGKRSARDGSIYPLPPAGDIFSPLLRDYPDSLAADVARWSLGHEDVEAGRFAPAAAVLIPLAERLPGRLPKGVGPFGAALPANLFYDAARAALETGQREKAGTLLAAAEGAVKAIMGPPQALVSAGWIYGESVNRVGGDLGYLQPRPPGNTPGWAGFAADLAALRARVNGLPTAPAPAVAFTWPVELVSRVVRGFGRDRLRFERELLVTLADAADRDPATFQRVFAGDGTPFYQTRNAVTDLFLHARTDPERAEIFRLAARIAAPMGLYSQRQLARATGDRPAEAAVVQRMLAKESDPGRAVQLKGEWLGLTEGPEARGDFLAREFRANPTPSGTPEAEGVFAWALDAGGAFGKAGRWDRAAEVYATLAARAGEPAWWCTAALRQAEAESRRGDPVTAAGLLRTVLDWAQGEEWTAQKGHYGQGGNLAAEAFARLQELRLAGANAPEPAGPLLGDGPIALPAGVPRDPAVAAELEEVLFEATLRQPSPASGELPAATADAFGRRHPAAATVPVLLDALARQEPFAEPPEDDPYGLEHARNEMNVSRLHALDGLLERAAANAPTPQALAAFRRFPEVSGAAFRLAPREASILVDHHARRLNGRVAEFARLATAHHLDRYLGELLGRVAAGKEMDRIVTAFDAMLQRQPEPAVEAQLRDALTRGMAQTLLARRGINLDWTVVGEVAGRRGLAAFIPFVLANPAFPPPFRAKLLRPRLAGAPDDDNVLLALADANRERWQWRAEDRKFHLPNP